MQAQLEYIEDGINPLDSVEQVLNAHNWVFNRMTDDELMVQVIGKACEYRLFFIWQEDMSALQFCCQYDLAVAPHNLQEAARSLMSLNENLWMGHFDIPKDTRIPSFRQTCLLRGVQDVSNAEHIEDLVDVSLAQCERYYPVFYMLAHAEEITEQTLSLALMHTFGEA